MKAADDIFRIPIPFQLTEIPQPPKQLFCRGAALEEDELMLTVVGSRAYTSYGKEACETLIAGLCGFPITIVSGLALGMDALAHNAALRTGLRTIAVPGSGLQDDVLYPRTNALLAKRIIEMGGSLLSEYPPDFRATRWSFVQRNRIMAGLSKAVLVIEAGERSGTLVTSRLATEYNRDVYAVPGSIFSDKSKGPNMLITLGATPIRTSEDILLALGFDVDTNSSDTKAAIDTTQFSEHERTVYALLVQPMERETLTVSLGLSASDANILLMKMEIAGLIKDTPLGLMRT